GRRGLGLGLALCKSIVEAHHGRIRLVDNDPHGCRFIISLPMKEVQVNE
ncbi:MAG: sensor histidine kinase, partial [Firmicutes bacterium]|nr:sensor histidine kinase [Bacillota bacterium]